MVSDACRDLFLVRADAPEPSMLLPIRRERFERQESSMGMASADRRLCRRGDGQQPVVAAPPADQHGADRQPIRGAG